MHPPTIESHVITTLEPHFNESLSDGGGQACPQCTRLAYNSIGFPTPTRRSMQMICIEEEAGSCIDQASPYESLPPMSPCRGLEFPPCQITRLEKESRLEITNGDFAAESTIVVAMSMRVHGGSPRAMHKSNACLGQMGQVSPHKFIYTWHPWLHFGGAAIVISLEKVGNALTAPRRSPR